MNIIELRIDGNTMGRFETNSELMAEGLCNIMGYIADLMIYFLEKAQVGHECKSEIVLENLAFNDLEDDKEARDYHLTAFNTFNCVEELILNLTSGDRVRIPIIAGLFAATPHGVYQSDLSNYTQFLEITCDKKGIVNLSFPKRKIGTVIDILNDNHAGHYLQ